MGLRPAPDTMAILTGYLPVEQAVACQAALKRHTDRLPADGDERTRDQIMADTLVAWLTGQSRPEDIDIEVQISMPFDSLLDPDTFNPDAFDPDGFHLDDSDPSTPNWGADPETRDPDCVDADDSDPQSSGGDRDPAAPGPAGGDADRPRPASRAGGSGVAHLLGYGPLPLDLAREVISSSRGRKWWRRLFTAPVGNWWVVIRPGAGSTAGWRS